MDLFNLPRFFYQMLKETAARYALDELEEEQPALYHRLLERYESGVLAEGTSVYLLNALGQRTRTVTE